VIPSSAWLVQVQYDPRRSGAASVVFGLFGVKSRTVTAVANNDGTRLSVQYAQVAPAGLDAERNVAINSSPRLLPDRPTHARRRVGRQTSATKKPDSKSMLDR
jgi:hypothetical protein